MTPELMQIQKTLPNVPAWLLADPVTRALFRPRSEAMPVARRSQKILFAQSIFTQQDCLEAIVSCRIETGSVSNPTYIKWRESVMAKGEALPSASRIASSFGSKWPNEEDIEAVLAAGEKG